MLKPDLEGVNGLDIEFELTPQKRSVLTSYVKHEGFDIIQQLLIDQVKKFNVKLINTPVDNKDAVIANHAMAKVVAQFYIGFITRIAEELKVHDYNAVAADKPVLNDIEIPELRGDEDEYTN